MGRFVIGVDGGGTKTLGAIAREDGPILAQTEVGSTNHHSNPIEVVRENLSALINNLVGAAGVTAADVGFICTGMAGVDRPDDKALVKGLMKEYLPNAESMPVNDGFIALVGGTTRLFGIIVIGGTGSLAFGVDDKGQSARAGGWGHILGDEGSGYMIGLRGLRAVMRAYDGRTGPTGLHDIVMKHFGFEKCEQILNWTKQVQGSKAEIGALSRLVFEACEAGDATAAQILREESDELALGAWSVAGRLFPGRSDFEIVVGGGNLRKSQCYFDLFKEAVARRLPGVGVIHPRKEPVDGAVIIAQQKLKES
jgi:N-acetylglucosamine kinase-like BadF-type ATPase